MRSRTLRKARKSLTKICKTILSLTAALGMALASASPAFAVVEGDINAETEDKPAQKAVAEEPVQGETSAPVQEEPTPEPVVEEPTPEPVEEAPEPEVTDDPAFLPDGTANVVDYAVSESGKEFFIIQTANGNSFYLVLDKDRQSDNVYLLSPVDEADLMDFVSTDQTEARSETEPAPAPIQSVWEESVETEAEIEVEAEAEPAVTGANPSTLLILLAVAIAGGAGYYLKVYKPRQAKTKRPDDLESMEFEDDPEINEDTPSGDLYVEDEIDDAIE